MISIIIVVSDQSRLQLLLGDLPTELPPEAFQTVGPAELSDTATQILGRTRASRVRPGPVR